MSNNKQQPKPENTNNQFSNTEPLTHAQRVAIANTMTNTKQTSVEWLVEKLGKYNEEMVFLYQNEIEQAKAIHKEEHAATARDWWIEGTSDARKASTGRYESFDDYYSKKFTSEQPTQD